YGSDEIPEELLMQELPIAATSGMRAPKDSALRTATPEESERLPRPDPAPLESTWVRALRLLEGRARRKLRPHEDRARRAPHHAQRTISSRCPSSPAHERA